MQQDVVRAVSVLPGVGVTTARRDNTNLSPAAFGSIAEGPLSNDGSLLVSARRSYLNLVLKAVGFPFIPAYSDVTIKAVRRPPARNEFSFLLIGAVDRITFINTTADIRYDNSSVLGSSPGMPARCGTTPHCRARRVWI